MGCTVGRGLAPAETLRFMGGSVESYMVQIKALRRGTAISPTVLSNIVPFNEPYKFQFAGPLPSPLGRVARKARSGGCRCLNVTKPVLQGRNHPAKDTPSASQARQLPQRGRQDSPNSNLSVWEHRLHAPYFGCLKPNFSAFLGQAFTQSPQRMHSGLLGVLLGSTHMRHSFAHLPQRTHFSSSRSMR